MIGGVTVAGLEGLLLQVRATKKDQSNRKTSLKSVSNSETDVTVNLTSFIELLV